jgi:hypothetical protein
LYLVQRIRLPLVQAVLGQLTDQTALRLRKPLLVEVEAVTASLQQAKVVLLVGQVVVADTPTKAAAPALAVKAITAAQVRLQLVVVVVRALLVVRQMAVLGLQIASPVLL